MHRVKRPAVSKPTRQCEDSCFEIVDDRALGLYTEDLSRRLTLIGWSLGSQDKLWILYKHLDPDSNPQFETDISAVEMNN